MKVLLLGRSGLLNRLGGDRIQIENTAEELRKLRIGVDISLGNDSKVDYSGYDLVHIFQLDWNPDSYFQAQRAKKVGKPLVLSPIHHSVREVQRFDNEYVFDFRRISKVLFKDQFHRDVFKDVYRSIFEPKLFITTLKTIFLGFKNMHRKTLQMADYVLVQTTREAEDLKNTYNVDFSWAKVCNGVSKNFLTSSEYANTLGFSNYIICVGRVEPRKNQLSIIEAVSRLRKETKEDLRLVIIGSKSGNKHFEYNWKFNLALSSNPWITHIHSVPYADMPSFYHFAKVDVSASWFETTGLTSLEAILSGANAVASGDRAREYLGEMASYCDPGDIDSIKTALKREFYAPRPVVDEHTKQEYTWENAAQKTLEIYNKLLSTR
ncbi:hypothetical protein A2415_04785 [candidate division WWE3 bacterium RIFOXYC1_FULL_39_7]|uniref:Glycosyl transferase family 1 domain-containing protein n=1 Tax=candidate division WWE3 bacterium RIFOXYC1_FULL_39_7 TaxID=1802643 RepID=A0A1F4WLI1_UNCKA|nr:MAG: hypothetical protein A2415_04785 [candidate division WWE3 bacterium RIFOXYC1_FULL_39_7]